MNNTVPLVSVAMSVYDGDRPSWLKRAIESVLGQTYRDLEFVIISDGVTNPELLHLLSDFSARDKRIRIIRLNANKGLANALNIIIEKSSGDFIVRMDADDISPAERIEKLVSFMEANPAIDAAGSYISEFDDDGNENTSANRVTTYPETHEEMKKCFYYRNPLAHPSMIFRRVFFDKAGLYPLYTYRNEDTILWLNGFRSNCLFATVPEVLYFLRLNRGSAARRVGLKKSFSDFTDRVKIIKILKGNSLFYLVASAVFIIQLMPKRLYLLIRSMLLQRLSRPHLLKNDNTRSIFSQHMKNSTLVSLLIVVRNEVECIEEGLNSLLDQTYPKSLTEIILIDGISTDGTREYLQKKTAELKKQNIDVKFLDNTGRILSTGWNIGIKAAKGEIVCRIDAHNAIAHDYVARGVSRLLEDPSIACVGGVEKYVGFGFGQILSDLYSSKFGVGNAQYRTGIKKAIYTDTAKCGLYRKTIFDRFGYFNESLVRNQDIALHSKILKDGYRFLTDPGMLVTYQVKGGFAEFIRKAYKNGFWVACLQKSYLRHKMPFIFVLYFFFLLILIPAINIFFENVSGMELVLLFPVFLYIALSVFFSIKDGKGLNKLFLSFLFPMFHLTYGAGTFMGLMNKVHMGKKDE